MASIKGIEFKNLKDFRGHEGEDLVQGDIYYKGKKVGYYSQDAWGGSDIFDLDYNLPKELRTEIYDIVKNYEGGKLFRKLDELYDKTYNRDFISKIKPIGLDFFTYDLLELIDHEELYKKYSKKWNLKHINIVYDTLWNRHICVELRKEDKDKTYFTYESLKDFEIE